MKNEMERIAVLGCGWLGLPLASQLKKDGFFVKGSTTQVSKLQEIAAHHIDPYIVQLNPKIVGDDIHLFLDVDLLIINIPPGRSTEEASLYQEMMENLAKAIQSAPIKRIIFISSTSVYPETNGSVNENSGTDTSASGLRMVNAEKVFKKLQNIKTTIIRMAGLIGPERDPGRFFGGKKDIPNGLAPVNLIHLDDCIGIIQHVIRQEIWDETINAAAPSHPTKKDFYTLASEKFNGSIADFLTEKGSYKIVDSSKIIFVYGYRFKYPDLMQWLLETHQN